MEQLTRRMLIALALTTLGSVAAVATVLLRVESLKGQLSDLDTKLQAQLPGQRQIVAIEKKRNEMKPKLELLGKAQQDLRTWGQLLRDVAKCAPAYTWLDNISVARPAGGVGAAAKKPPAEMLLKGMAPDQSSVGSYMLSLNNVAYFKDVRLNFTESSDFQGEPVTRFELQCPLVDMAIAPPEGSLSLGGGNRIRPRPGSNGPVGAPVPGTRARYGGMD